MKDANKNPLGVRGKLAEKAWQESFPLTVQNKIQGKSNYQLEVEGRWNITFISFHKPHLYPLKHHCYTYSSFKTMLGISGETKLVENDGLGFSWNILVLADLIAFTIISVKSHDSSLYHCTCELSVKVWSTDGFFCFLVVNSINLLLLSLFSPILSPVNYVTHSFQQMNCLQ